MNEKNINPATTDQIAARAYEIWVNEGCPQGRDIANWTQAEKELQAASPNGAGTSRTSPLQRATPKRNNAKQRETVAA